MATICKFSRALAGMILTAACSACGAGSGPTNLDSVRLTQAQTLADFDVMAATFQDLYGPMAYKEDRFHFKFAQLAAKARSDIAASSGDAEAFGVLTRFIASFHDGHLNITFPDSMHHITSYDLPVYVAQVEDRAIVVKADLTDHMGGGVAIGDELVATDGKTPMELLATLKLYGNLATPVSTKYLMMQITHRPFYVKELVPTQPVALLEFVKPDQTHYQLEVPWVETPKRPHSQNFALQRPGAKNFVVHGVASLFNDPATPVLNFGSSSPFFVTPAVTAALQLQPATLDLSFQNQFKVDAAALKDIYAATYTYKGQHVLLLRQPSYDVSTTAVGPRMNAYRALLAQYQPVTDVLVLDQTHNPGGDLDYVTQFFSLFASRPAANQVEHLHADRKWYYDLQAMADAAAVAPTATTPSPAYSPAEATQYQYMAAQVDAAIDAGDGATTPLPLEGFSTIMPDQMVTWKKPMLVLADEMSGSCGDIFPMLVQRNHIAKIFGQITMGLGGNVDDSVITLPNSQATLDMTRGLYTTYRTDGAYSDADLVENNGIVPDYPYDHTVADVRAGFVRYVHEFSDAAIAQISR